MLQEFQNSTATTNYLRARGCVVESHPLKRQCILDRLFSWNYQPLYSIITPTRLLLAIVPVSYRTFNSALHLTLLPVTDHYKFLAHLLNTSTVPQPVRQPVIPWCFSPPHANQPPWYLLHLGLFHKLISSRLHHRSVSHSQHTLDCIPNPPTGVIKDVCNSNSSIPYLLLASIREITIQSPPCACPVSNNLLKYRI